MEDGAFDGIVRIKPEAFERGERVRVVEGVQWLRSHFERYLSGTERVALLLRTIEANGIRVVLPSLAVAKSP